MRITIQPFFPICLRRANILYIWSINLHCKKPYVRVDMCNSTMIVHVIWIYVSSMKKVNFLMFTHLCNSFPNYSTGVSNSRRHGGVMWCIGTFPPLLIWAEAEPAHDASGHKFDTPTIAESSSTITTCDPNPQCKNARLPGFFFCTNKQSFIHLKETNLLDVGEPALPIIILCLYSTYTLPV